MQICESELCLGCFACLNVCNKNAIYISLNIYGEEVPVVDNIKCSDCGLCKSVCPVNNSPIYQQAEQSYAVQSTNLADGGSSSGGVAAVLSRKILKSGGVVYGATSIDRTTKHIKIESISEIDLLRGSKYVQSEIGYIYRDVKKILKNKKQFVLFFGTPCQIAGLLSYLQYPYENLFTVDLICHGVPPHNFLKEHLNKKTKKWDSYSFRGKYNYVMTAYQDGNIVYQRSCEQDEYFKTFLEGMIFRKICYNCPFARPERVADITIGDFWGLKRKSLKKTMHGRISVLLANTTKGKLLFNDIKKDILWEERPFTEAANQEQHNLLLPSNRHPESDLFLFYYPKVGFDKAVLKTALGAKIKKEQLTASFYWRAWILCRSHLSKSIIGGVFRKIKHVLYYAK